MSLSQPDESLLTAYLDGELSDHERALVEEQLKVNEHWKQLLVELRNLQSLIRDLPTPVLKRSLTEGPWSQNPQQNSTTGIVERSTTSANGSSFSLSILAIAASLLLFAVGSFAWIRYSKDDLQVVMMEKTANIDAMAGDELAATPADRKDIAEPSTATSLAMEREEAKLDQSLGRIEMKSKDVTMATTPETDVSIALSETPIPMLNPSSPMPSSSSQLSNQNGIAGNGRSKLQLSQRFLSISPEPIDTFLAVRAGSSMNSPQGGLANESAAQSEPVRALEALQAESAGAASPQELNDDRSKVQKNLGGLSNPLDQQRELRIMRSDLPLVLQQLREQGWEIQNNTHPIERQPVASRSMQRLGEAEPPPNEEATPRPPTLTGALSEPTDWVRIIFQDKTTN